MKNLKSQDSTYNAEQEINQIYQKVKDGENFADLAKQFSDHNPTASKGGELSPFSVGDLNSQKFGDVAFSLDKNDSISKPFETQFGWHIVKYIDNIPVQRLEEIKQDVVKKIKTSDRSKRLIKNIDKDLKQKYEVKINYEVLSLLENRIDDSIFKFKWTYEDTENDRNEWVLKIDDQDFMVAEFLEYIQKQQRSLNDKSIGDKINTAIDNYTYSKLIQIHNQNLENVSPEFAAEIKKYYEGLLLFEIMENKIWAPVQKDSIALQEHFEANRGDFMTKAKIDGILASAISKKVVKKIKKEIEIESVEVLKQNFPEAIFKPLAKTEITDSALPQSIILQEDYSNIYNHNGQYLCLYITKLYPSENLKFEEVRGEIINILQKKEEDKWIDELKSKYDIYLNIDLIENLQTNLEN
jgi:peptidyl-prolyl cis-trans isomerase SurA